MVTVFHYTGVQMKAADVVVCCSEAKEDASEIIAIQFPASVTAALDAHPWAEHFKIGEIWFSAKIPFKGSDFGFGMNQSIDAAATSSNQIW